MAFDIETTGFDVTDEVTVVGFALPLGCRVFVRGDEGMDAEGVAATVRDAVGEAVSLSVHASEAALLRAVGEFAAERINGEDVLVVAYNRERWRGGFDLPFLRTRLAATGVAWPFQNVPYADVLPVVEKLFNTSRDGESRDDLVGAYAALVGDGVNAADPFTESAEAVTAFNEGQTAALVQHNAVDTLRTRALTLLAEQYCSKSDFKLKSLTPTVLNE
ncbi:ribonuclease H-like domain-containing protein [Halorubrum salsamenti]|uniref:ribonuclease H-like domain-containing protein n=1 Tax=Halorubrum salsamenti TaxID=2583990 RepID=UPI001F4F12F6|nr:ribonuclease H-like domain-containing protein [Halorubrum salsamenti]